MSNWLSGLVGVASLLLGGGGLAVLVNAVTGRRIRKAEVADRMSDSALKWVEQFQEETASARQEAAESRREVDAMRKEVAESRREVAASRREVEDMRREIAVVRADAEVIGRELRSIRTLIHSPGITIDMLKNKVPPQIEPPVKNGR